MLVPGYALIEMVCTCKLNNEIQKHMFDYVTHNPNMCFCMRNIYYLSSRNILNLDANFLIDGFVFSLCSNNNRRLSIRMLLGFSLRNSSCSTCKASTFFDAPSFLSAFSLSI